MKANQTEAEHERPCRLCLAPENECLDIFANYAADKQPLELKIQDCVHITVFQGDSLSPMICHACISYLNSWQSFKNRCDDAERKQRETGLSSSLSTMELKSPSKQIANQSKESFIKEEPLDVENANELDPSNFLLQSQEDVDGLYVQGNDQPNGGLGEVNEQPEDYANASGNEMDEEDADSANKQLFAACSVCDITFSNRANARRHERNIHGLHQSLVILPAIQAPLDSGGQIETFGLQEGIALSSTRPKAHHLNDLRQRIRTKLRVHRETYDYKNPAKYRHLVTPNKLSFIMRNLEFLEQAQHMKCNCCNKSYPSYKYFMGHMRKKYQNLPRNVCFKCLRQFGSKGQFIGHLKRKTCINLYAIVMADDSIPKELPEGPVLETKEIISNKNYGCKLCNMEFKSKTDLKQKHMLDVHPEVINSGDNTGTLCLYCGQNFTEPIIRKKHDCLMFIVCCSCGERFDSNSSYVDHAYQNHLPQQKNGQDEFGYDLFDQDGNSSSSHLRNPQNCPVCDKQYNNYYNVLRHMESKHPNQLPQIYQCTKCSEGFPRQSELREHLNSVHGETSARQQKQPPTMVIDSGRPTFVCKFCLKTLAHLSEWIEHQDVDHSKFSCVRCDFTTDDREKFSVHCFIEHRNFCTSTQRILYSCRQCSETYSSIDGLQEHIKVHNQNTQNEECLPSNGSTTAPTLPEPLINEEPFSDDQPVVGRTLNCGLCDFALTNIDALRQHMSEFHGMDKKFFYCNQCPAKFMNDRGLRFHLFRLHGVRDESSFLKPTQQISVATPQLPLSNDDSGSSSQTSSLNECTICHIVYKNNEQLSLHLQLVHPSLDNKVSITEEKVMSPALQQPVLWFQCRYCVESFNASKKLTLHMNSAHDEVDKSDYSCKDCGGIYGSKKSLWVHRYKKHPKIPDPSACEICSKVFFDKMELFHHTSHVHVAGVAENMEGISNDQDFQDVANGALFSMFNTSVVNMEADLSRNSSHKEETVYQCDMCPKTFLILRNLQSHRGWHYRSPDGRKVRDPNDIWQPDQLPPSKLKRKQSGITVHKIPPTCHHCQSTFASTNNLKRHITEVHKIKPSLNSSTSDLTQNDHVRNAEIRDQHVHGESNIFVNVNDTEENQLQHGIKEELEELCDPNTTADDEFPEEIDEHDEDDGNESGEQYFCELCQVYFTSANALRQHVSEHFLNGGIGIEGQLPLQKGDNQRMSTDSIGSTNSSRSNTSETETET